MFRIASMSKSFTASAILLLRDAGALGLDDPAARYVPELAGWVNGAADAGPLTIRHLLTMTAGFPTDDPWGDRQQGLPLDEFRALLAGGVGFNWAPGTRFEYSNLGYAILGLIVTAASGVPYDEFIRTRLLTPLGLARTGFAAQEFPAAELAVGHRRGPAGLAASCRSTRTARSRRWAACSPASPTWRPGARGSPRRSRPTVRPADGGRTRRTSTRSRRPPGGSCSCRRR